MPQTKELLTACLMVKNEALTIERTLLTCKGICNSICILDTGSKDCTIPLIKDTCKKMKMPLYLYEEPFIDFSCSRNRLLELAKNHSNAHFLLLMDANDEIRGAEQLRSILKRNMDSDVFTIALFWLSDAGMIGFETRYSRICIVNSKNTSVKYIGKIHEYLTTNEVGKFVDNHILLQTNFHLFQDREKDTTSTQRFYRDIEILLEDLKEQTNDFRTLFYLGITYRNIKDYENSLLYFNRRIAMEEKINNEKDGKKDPVHYTDELYMSYIHSLELSMMNQRSEDIVKHVFTNMLKYISRFPHITRAEHFIILSGYYMDRKPLFLEHVEKSFMMAKKACLTPIPKDPKIVIKTNLYSSVRWYLYLKAAHILGKTDDSLYAEAMTHADADMLNSLPAVQFPQEKKEVQELPEDIPAEVRQQIQQQILNLRNNTDTSTENSIGSYGQPFQPFQGVSSISDIPQQLPPQVRQQLQLNSQSPQLNNFLNDEIPPEVRQQLQSLSHSQNKSQSQLFNNNEIPPEVQQQLKSLSQSQNKFQTKSPSHLFNNNEIPPEVQQQLQSLSQSKLQNKKDISCRVCMDFKPTYTSSELSGESNGNTSSDLPSGDIPTTSTLRGGEPRINDSNIVAPQSNQLRLNLTEDELKYIQEKGMASGDGGIKLQYDHLPPNLQQKLCGIFGNNTK